MHHTPLLLLLIDEVVDEQMEKCVASMEWIGWHGATQHNTRQDCVGLFVVLMGGVHTTTWFVVFVAQQRQA